MEAQSYGAVEIGFRGDNGEEAGRRPDRYFFGPMVNEE